MTRTDQARQLAVHIFDEDIVRPELELDEASINLVAGLIEAALADVERSTLAQLPEVGSGADYDRYQAFKKQIVQEERERCAQMVERSMTGLEIIKPQMELLAAAIRQEPTAEFCRFCGASIPHRIGEGRCPKCAHHDKSRSK